MLCGGGRSSFCHSAESAGGTVSTRRRSESLCNGNSSSTCGSELLSFVGAAFPSDSDGWGLCNDCCRHRSFPNRSGSDQISGDLDHAVHLERLLVEEGILPKVVGDLASPTGCHSQSLVYCSCGAIALGGRVSSSIYCSNAC